MRARTLPAIGIGVATLALIASSTLPAAAGSTVSTTAAGVAGASAAVPGSALPAVAAKGKCKTAFGTVPSSPNGIISIFAGGLDASGAADFTCPKKKKKRTFSTVTVKGYFGDAGQSNFNVTVLGNSASNEPDSSNVVCSSMGVVGAPTGAQYPVDDTTVIKLDKPCMALAGTNWLQVQSTAGTNWYWEVQANIGGNYPADWREAGGFGSPCTAGYVDGRYMQDCIFGGDAGTPDFMFTLSS